MDIAELKAELEGSTAPATEYHRLLLRKTD
jgi:hypothetical protein